MKKLFLLIILILTLVGCSTVKYIPVETVRLDTTYIEKVRYDSIFSDRYHNQYIKGDTVYLTDSIYLYKYKMLRDTTYINRIDSIPYPVEVYIEKEPSFLKIIKNCWFWIITILAFLFFLKIYRCSN